MRGMLEDKADCSTALCCCICVCCRCHSTASYVRLELLEGVVAYHSGEPQLAQQKLQAAQARWQKLQVGGVGGRVVA